MQNNQKYIPFVFLIPALIEFVGEPRPLGLEFAGVVAVFFLVFLLFVYLERSVKTRVRNISRYESRKLAYMLRFSVLYGLPLSVMLMVVLARKVHLMYSILLIALPLIILFGWLGSNDWKECRSKYLEMKHLSNQ